MRDMRTKSMELLLDVVEDIIKNPESYLEILENKTPDVEDVSGVSCEMKKIKKRIIRVFKVLENDNFAKYTF